MEDLKIIKNKIKDLTEKINYHNNLYYNKDNPEISDFEYDKLFKKLLDLEEKYPNLKETNSPTNKIGGTASLNFNKIKHKIYMGSLQNAYSFDELLKFEKKTKEKVSDVSYIVEPKVDGLSVSLEYENGKFVRGSTRGDGFFGEDVTENLKTISTIPKTLHKNIPFLEVRAEIYMPTEKFNELILKQQTLKENIFKNPRNAAAGSLRQKNPFITSTRGLKAICFNIQQINFNDFELYNHYDTIEFLKNLGFYTIPESKIYFSIKDCMEKINEIYKQKNFYDYEIDGAVIKINSLKTREILGSTAKNPHWAIAYKYPPKQEQTILRKIEIKVGRTGVLTPVAVFDEINLEKTTINRATLHNQDYITKNDIRIGDIITIRKAGEIIPEVVKSIKHEKNSIPYKIPTTCPVCKNKVIKTNSFYVCINPNCKATLLQNIIHFVSKNAMNIPGLGEQTIKTLVKNKLIDDVADLYLLKKEDILKLEGFKEKSANNLIYAINNSKKNPYWRLLFGLGIKEVGQKTAKILYEKYDDMIDIINATEEELTSIENIGKITALNIVKYFSLEKTKTLIKKLQNLNINTINVENNMLSLKLKNLKFAITGKIESSSREEIKNLIEQHSGTYLNSISSKTTYLIVGKNAGSKLEKAKKLNIKTISEQEFFKMIEN